MTDKKPSTEEPILAVLKRLIEEIDQDLDDCNDISYQRHLNSKKKGYLSAQKIVSDRATGLVLLISRCRAGDTCTLACHHKHWHLPVDSCVDQCSAHPRGKCENFTAGVFLKRRLEQ